MISSGVGNYCVSARGRIVSLHKIAALLEIVAYIDVDGFDFGYPLSF